MKLKSDCYNEYDEVIDENFIIKCVKRAFDSNTVINKIIENMNK